MNKSAELSRLIIDGIQDRKGRGISVIDLSGIDTAAADTFIIANGTSPTQVAAISDSVWDYVMKHSSPAIKPYNVDGQQRAEWIVMDYGSVWVHIFLPEVRSHYNLEELWSDAPITQIPDLD